MTQDHIIKGLAMDKYIRFDIACKKTVASLVQYFDQTIIPFLLR